MKNNIKEKVVLILDFLEKNYRDAKCSLIYTKPHELLIATRLSAQCTDSKVNNVTKELFLKYKDIYSFSNASVEEIKKIINPCGLSNKKASDIVNMSKILVSEFNSTIPNEMEKLLKLPGVGRKTANLILGELYEKPAIVVDTHLIRISNRLGLVNEKNPNKIEGSLKKIIPKEESLKFCHRIIEFGREICRAKVPFCDKCQLKNLCVK